MSVPTQPIRRGRRGLLELPECNIVLFALLLNFPWEIYQAPLFAGMEDARHRDAVEWCSRATLGDAVILLSAYWLVALATRTRRWILAPTAPQLALFVVAGLAVTVAIERLALSGRWFQGWSYAPAMPVVVGLGIGVAPLLQWLVLPPLVVWLVGRQLMPRRGEYVAYHGGDAPGDPASPR